MPLHAKRASCLLATLLLLPHATTEAQSPRDARLAAVDRIFGRFDRRDSPGCALGVLQDGRFLVLRGYGSAHLDFQAPITPRTVFYLASVSKQFTAASVILLAGDGKLSLDDDIRKHFPELPDYGHRVTVRQMIHHTSGLRDYLTLMPMAGLRGENVNSDDDILQLIVRQRELNFPAGSEYLYSNTGYYLLSELVRRVSGQSLREFAHARIFAPLRMPSTHFHDDRLMIVPQRASAYSPAGEGFRLDMWANFDKVGSGGLMSSIEDLAKWDRNFYTREVGGDFLHRQLHRQGVLTNGDTLPYAGGLNVGSYRGLRTVRHGGSTAGYRTELLRFPDHRFSVIALCNASNATPASYANRIAELWLGDRMEPRAAEATDDAAADAGDSSDERPEAGRLPDTELELYLGDYESDELGTMWNVALRADTLVLRHPLGERVLRQVATDRFRSGSMTVEFTREEGRVTEMRIGQGRVRMVRFRKSR